MSDFSDLRARTLSALAMIAVGGLALWLGGGAMVALALVLAALMGWELHRLMAPDAAQGRAEGAGLAAALLVAVFTLWQSGLVSLAGLALGAAVLAWNMPRQRLIFGLYLLMAMMAAHGLVVLRAGFGLAFVLWIVGIVVVSDIAGYFAGRLIGGPKFWPRVSPKKTWSGTVAGWIGAAFLGAGFAGALGLSWLIVPLSVVLSFAGQMGDIAESAIKRRAGVKDSSALIPGHGGVLDRFDAMIAVASLAWLMALAGLFSGMAR